MQCFGGLVATVQVCACWKQQLKGLNWKCKWKNVESGSKKKDSGSRKVNSGKDLAVQMLQGAAARRRDIDGGVEDYGTCACLMETAAELPRDRLQHMALVKV